MGLLYHILYSTAHLLFVVMDIFVVMIAAKAIYSRWRLPWLKPAINAIEPIMAFVLNHVRKFSAKVSSKRYSERTIWILILIFLSAIRFLITSFIQIVIQN